MNDVLLVWETVPEETQIFWLDGLTEDERRRVVALHGSFINAADNTEEQDRELEWLSELLGTRQHVWSTAEPDGVPFSVSRSCTVVVSGFLL